MSMFSKITGMKFLLPGVVILALLVATGVVLAVNSSDVFELDGDAVDGTGGGDDWENVYNTHTESENGGSAGQSLFITDGSGNDDIIFTQGGSKDINDVSEWAYTTGSPPDKDDLLDAYVAAYVDDGELLLYFGADRYANNGDAQIGFWFFQQPVEPLPNGSFGGSHVDGDILILSNFVGGGGTSNIQIYQWNGQSDLDNPLALIGEASGEGALSVCINDDQACASTNEGGQESPWPYEPKSGDVGIFPEASFFEGGLNLSALLGEDNVGCFSSFLAETRSSQEESAQLKDFAIGSIEFCSVEIAVVNHPLSKVGDQATYTFTVENNGLLTIHLQSINDSLLGDLTADASAAGCDTLAAGTNCEFSVSYTIQPEDPDTLPGTVTVDYNGSADGSGDSVGYSSSYEINLFQPSIEFDISGDSSVSVGDTANFTLTLNNTGSEDSPNLTCTISDELLGISEDLNIASGGQHIVEASYTTSQNDVGTLVSTASVSCQVDGFPNILEATDDYALDVSPANNDTDDQPAEDDSTQDDPDEQPPEDEDTQDDTADDQPAADDDQSTAEDSTADDDSDDNDTDDQSLADDSDDDEEDEPEVPEFSDGEQGCSPGFWQGGKGRKLWNEENDEDWTGTGSSPHTHLTEFNSFFESYSETNEFTVYQFVRRGGGRHQWRKAARNVVAGYLNASYGMNYPFTPQEVAQMWADAVNGSISFATVHQTLGAANNLGCGVP